MGELKNKVVIITGSGKGIGRGMAEVFAKNGAITIIATRGEDSGIEVEKSIISQGYEAKFIKTDVSSEKSIKNMVEKVLQLYGKIDVLINNAGITLFKPLIDATIEDWEQVINIDLRGTFLCSKYVAESMIKNNISGSIINISSNHAFRTLPDTEIYAAAKGGVNAMTRSMALSLGKYNIRVNAICPGFTDTPHYQNWLSEKDDPNEVENEVNSLHANGSICKPEDIANIAMFLSTEKSNKITGSEILIDNGMTAKLYDSEIC